MDPAYALRAQGFFGRFNPMGNLVGGFDAVDLHIHDADAELDSGRDVLQRVKVCTRPVSNFQHQVIGMQGVEEFQEGSPVSLANRLAAVSGSGLMPDPLLRADVPFVEVTGLLVGGMTAVPGVGSKAI